MIPATSSLMHFFIKTLNWCYIKRGMMALTPHTDPRVISTFNIFHPNRWSCLFANTVTLSLLLLQLAWVKNSSPLSLSLLLRLHKHTEGGGEHFRSGHPAQHLIHNKEERRPAMQGSPLFKCFCNAFSSLILQYSLSTILFLLRPHIKWKGCSCGISSCSSVFAERHSKPLCNCNLEKLNYLRNMSSSEKEMT